VDAWRAADLRIRVGCNAGITWWFETPMRVDEGVVNEGVQ